MIQENLPFTKKRKIHKNNTNPSLLSPLGGLFVEVRDSPHGIFGSCTRYPRGLARWAELLGRRRRRRRHQEIQVDIQAREQYLEFVPMDLVSDETSLAIDTTVLHRISIPFIWAERFGLGTHFCKSDQISRNAIFFQNMHVHFSRNRFPK